MRLAAMLVTAVLTALLLPLIAVVTATPAFACSCVTSSEAEQFERAEAVFEGTLVGRDAPPGPMISSMDPVTLTFDVSRVYKGDVDASQAVETANSGASCGLEVEGEGPFLVFAEDARSSIGKLSANLCGGTRAVGVDEPAFGPGTPPPGASATPEAPAAPAQAPEGGAPDWLVPVLVLAGVSLAAALGAALIVRTRRKSAD